MKYDIVTWEEAADRIQDMYEEGNYVDNLISNNAIEQEQKEMTDLLALHFRDTKENAKATINKYMADIKKFLFFWQMISGSIKKYCCNIKNGLLKNMLSIVLIQCLPP